MTARTNRINWLIFVALGFMWGSSYLFIKLAIDDFGTFTLVALRLLVGALLLWGVVRIAGQQLPRERRIYGHLLVMAIINITIPFLLITWAEQSVESSLAAILTSPVPLFAIVLSAIFLQDEPMRVNGVVGLVVGFIGVVIITSRGLTGQGSSIMGEIAALGAAFSYACGAVYSRRNVRGLPPMIPAVFQVTFAAIITGTLAILVEQPWTVHPMDRRSSRSCGSASWVRAWPTWPCSGCSPPGAPHARRSSRISCRWSASSSATWSSRSRSTRGCSSGQGSSSRASGWSTAGSGGGACSGARRRSRPSDRRARGGAYLPKPIATRGRILP